MIVKVLVAQPGKIGDLVCTTPLFRTLEQHFQHPVDILAGPFAHDLLKGNTAVGEIYTKHTDPKIIASENYSHILVLMPSIEVWKLARIAAIPNVWSTTHAWMPKKEKLLSLFYVTKKFPFQLSSIQDHYLKMAVALGANKLVTKREVHSDNHDEQKIQTVLQERNLTGKKLVGISVTGGKDFKEWGLDNYKQLVEALNAEDFVVTAFGTKEERPKLAALEKSLASTQKFFNLAGELSLSEFAALAQRLMCFIAADTAPLYIADALEIAVVDLMGPCRSVGQKPQGAKAVIVGECQNPSHPKCFMMYSPNALRQEFQRCMREISFAEVWDAFKSLTT